MKGPITALLEQGIEAAQNDERERARDVLLRVVELDRHNAKAWLWLSSAVETAADQEVCLENVLFVDPGNSHAITGLRYLRGQPRDAADAPATLPRLCEIAAGEAIPRRGRRLTTLLEALGGALVFDRAWAFQPEVELASWGRGLSALVLAALLAAAWHGLASFVLWLLAGEGTWGSHVATGVLVAALHALPPALLLALAGLPAALLAWAAARLLGGRRPLRTHVHLTAVAFSAWVVWAALLAPLGVLAPRVFPGLPFDLAAAAAGLGIGAGGAAWLVQAALAGQPPAARRVVVAALVATAAGAGILFALDRSTGGRSTDLVGRLIAAAFLPLPDLRGGWSILAGG